MRVMVMFDLPTVTSKDIKNYNKFRKFLITEGFIMMQESIYTKLALNGTVANLVKEKVRKSCPPEGLVQMLVLTEKQFSNMEYIIGTKDKHIVDSESRLMVF